MLSIIVGPGLAPGMGWGIRQRCPALWKLLRAVAETWQRAVKIHRKGKGVSLSFTEHLLWVSHQLVFCTLILPSTL